VAAFHTKDISNSSFLVTGGAGFIGSHIVAYLLQHGAGMVRVLDNLSTGHAKNIEHFRSHPNFEFLDGDIRNVADCIKACSGMHYVTHQAALGSVPRSIIDPVNTNEVNVSGFVNIITAAKEAHVRSLVYASSSSVYGDEASLPKKEEKVGYPLSPYAVSKKTNELYASVFHKLYDMNVIGLRYFNVFGPNQDPDGPYAAVIPLFVNSLLNGWPMYIDGDGQQTRDFTYVDNAVQANIKALLTDNKAAFGEVYNVAVGEQFSVNYLFETVQGLLQSAQQAKYREMRSGDIRNSLADISKARTLLDYDPKYRFEDGLKITVDYFKRLRGTAN